MLRCHITRDYPAMGYGGRWGGHLHYQCHLTWKNQDISDLQFRSQPVTMESMYRQLEGWGQGDNKLQFIILVPPSLYHLSPVQHISSCSFFQHQVFTYADDGLQKLCDLQQLITVICKYVVVRYVALLMVYWQSPSYLRTFKEVFLGIFWSLTQGA